MITQLPFDERELELLHTALKRSHARALEAWDSATTEKEKAFYLPVVDRYAALIAKCRFVPVAVEDDEDDEDE